MDVLDLVVVLVGASSDLNTSDKNVSKFSGIPFGSDSGNESFDIDGLLDVESCIPLTVLRGEIDWWTRCGEHGKNRNGRLPMKIFFCMTYTHGTSRVMVVTKSEGVYPRVMVFRNDCV